MRPGRSRRSTRRQFLQRAALAPFLAAPARALAQSTAADPVVVIGAGLAGLRAAQLLVQAKRPVIVLEARGTSGGRVRTVRGFDEGLYAEAGPIRIAGMHRTLLRVLTEHQLNLIPFSSANGAALVNVGGVSARTPDDLATTPLVAGLKPEEAGQSQGALLDRYVGGLPDDLGELNPTAAQYARWAALDAVTWPDWLRARGASDGAVRLMTLGGDSSNLSALYILRQRALLQQTSEFYKIQGGMDRLPNAMALSLRGVVRYNTPVVRIEQGANSVRVDHADGATIRSLRASRVIVTVPFSVLRHIDIRPALPAARARVVEALPYFPATRFLLQARTRFWFGDGLSGAARTDQPAEMWDATYNLAGTRGILAATVGGALGEKAADMGRDDAVRFGAGLAGDVFPQMRAAFERGVVMRWSADPWARGAFAVFHPGQMTSMMPGIGSAEGRIHFAGEHTSSWMGWMEGALESGERAAREVME